ncbi:MAG: hypothetical protein H0V88_10135 [Pyrinomonadaceae bacterium]|nr:hypothetical protein [Pyrinomonadaceae bacterium]
MYDRTLAIYCFIDDLPEGHAAQRGVGIVIGLSVSLAFTRIISNLLYNVSATDPVTFAGVTAISSVVALLACYIPARRAMRIAPMIALRYE